MAQAIANSRLNDYSTFASPGLRRLIAVLAVLDISIWSYVAVAANMPPVTQDPPVRVALQLPQS